MKKNLTILLNKGYDDYQRTLFNKTFAKNFTKEQWRRKHFCNPCKSSENVCLYDDDELIGFNMFMPQRYLIGSREYVILQSCESVIEEKRRGNGYLKYILLEAENMLKNDYQLIYGIPNANSKPTFDKLGYKTKLSLDRYFAYGSMINIAKDLLLKKLPAKKDFLNKIDDYFLFKKTKILCTNSFDEKDLLPTDDCIQIKRTADYYNWKTNNENKKHRFFYVKDDEKVTALCVVELSNTGKLSRAKIIDLYVLDNHTNDLHNIINVIKRLVSAIDIMAVHDGKHHKLLLENGFKIKEERTCYLMYKIISEDPFIKEKMCTEENWEFNFIECDTILN